MSDKESPTGTIIQKEKVSVDVAERVGDGTSAFFIGFMSEKGGTEYLIMEKNGEPEPKVGEELRVQNRHHIESFKLFKEGEEWSMEAKRTPARYLS